MKLYFVFILLFFNQLISAVSAQESEAPNPFVVDKVFCQDKLNEEIEKLIKQDDSEILMNSFNLASLKLAYKVLGDGGKGKTLEEYARAKAKELKEADKNKLREKVASLYQRFGKSANLSKVNSIIDNLDKHNYFPKSERLSNEDSAVLMMAFEYMEPCSQKSLCINENDTAIVWFMDKVANKVESDTHKSELGNLLRNTVKVAHSTGVFSNTTELSLDQIKEKVSKLSAKNRKIMRDFNERFNQKYAQCLEVLGGAACFAQASNQAFQGNLNKILSELEESSVKNIPGSLKVKLTDGMVLNLEHNLIFNKKEGPDRQVASFPTSLNLPAEIVKGDAPFTCGGKTFEAESKVLDIWAFDPLRLWGNIKSSKTPWKEADRLTERKQKATNYKAARGNKGAGFMSLFNKLCPKIPISAGIFSFKCSTYMKWIVLRRKRAEAKVCCQEQVQWKEYVNLFAGTTGGIEGKVFVGIPYLAEFGGILGLGATLNVGGGGVPEGCIEKKCISGTVLLSAYGGLYLDVGIKDVMKSAIGGEAKIAWKPYATLRQCLYPSNHLPPAELKLSMGSIWFQGTVYAGWVFSYDFYEKIWESKKEDTFDIAIF